MITVDRALILLPTGRPPGQDGGRASGRKLLGLTFLERAVLTAAGDGVKDFILVGESGRGWEAVAARLKQDRRVRNRALRLEFAGLAALKEVSPAGSDSRPFWLIRGDLVFETGLLARAAAAERGDDEALHLVLGGGSYSGVSLYPAAAFPELAAALAQPGRGIPAGDALPDLPGPLRSRRLDIDGSFCLRVDSPEATRKARRYLLNSARKPTDGFFSRNFNRHISLFLTRGFLKMGVHPAVLSVATLLIGLASGWFVSRGGYPAAALGGFLFDFASIFDGCDGENARLTFRTSKFGAFLDIGGDAVIFVLFFLCLPVGLYRGSRNPLWIYLGVLAVVSMGTFYLQLVRYMRKARLGSNIVAIAKDIEGSPGKPGFSSRLDAVASKLAFIYRRDFFSTGACVIVMAGGAHILMLVLAVFMPLESLYMFFFARRHLRHVAPPGPSGA